MDKDCYVHCDLGCTCEDCWRCTPKGRIPVTPVWNQAFAPRWWKWWYGIILAAVGLSIYAIFLYAIILG